MKNKKDDGDITYKDIMSKSLQKCSTTAIILHPLDDFFVMEIDYDKIINLMVADLHNSGYIIDKHQ
jgi:hypothetical protein